MTEQQNDLPHDIEVTLEAVIQALAVALSLTTSVSEAADDAAKLSQHLASQAKAEGRMGIVVAAYGAEDNAAWASTSAKDVTIMLEAARSELLRLVDRCDKPVKILDETIG